MRQNWGADVYSAMRTAKIEIVGQDDIKNEAQARVFIGLINAYGSSSAGFVYVEPCTTVTRTRPPDVLLCHPEVGLLIIEVKGDTIDDIQGLKGGSLILRRGGFNQPINPIRQAENAMYEIEDGVRRVLGRRQAQPLGNVMVAFPNISESDWTRMGYDKAYPNQYLIFKETIKDVQRLTKRIGQLVTETLKESHKEKPVTAEQIDAIKQVFGDSAVINERRPPRAWVDERKLGAYLDQMMALDKYLSAEQQELSRLNLAGYPRLIRGVAGSGKSVVLANMVARYLNRRLTEPADMFSGPAEKPYVGVLCFNRSLAPFLKNKIRDAYKQQTLEQLPDDVIKVSHLNGLFWDLGQQGVLNYQPIHNGEEAIRAANYIQQLKSLSVENPDWYKSILFDAIFVDEGQDIAPEEYQLLLHLAKTDPNTGEKTLVIFYDDAQNLYARTRPNWRQIGIDVQRGDRARVMKECFRNPREVVELAFNVLLGTQSGDNTPVHTRTFADVNYLKQISLVEELGDHFKVRFTERSFEKSKILTFNSRHEEMEWVANEVVRLIEDEMVRPEDILVLFHHSPEFDGLPEVIDRHQKNGAIRGFIRPYGGGDDRDRYIFRENYLTLSTTYGAKGYDAMIVFLIGADLFETDAKGRASFYVGATRSKMMLYITGLNISGSLLSEAEAVNRVI